MIVVNLKGGLCNQMFQTAFAIGTAKKLKTDYMLDKRHFKNYFEHNFQLNVFKEFPLFTDDKALLTMFVERQAHYDVSVTTMQGNIFFDGYWQSYRYFEEVEPEVRQTFAFKPHPHLQEQLDQINSFESVAMHFRRTDYFRKDVQQVLGVCSMAYYNEAYDLIKKKIPNAKFFVFSDDIEGVKLEFKREAIFMPKWSGIEDLFLMSHCNHQVIANSTFSWWAAYLNKNENKTVIAPHPWYADKLKSGLEFYLKDWIIIPKHGA